MDRERDALTALGISPAESARIFAEVKAEHGPVPMPTRAEAIREAGLEAWAESREDAREEPEVWDALLGRDP